MCAVIKQIFVSEVLVKHCHCSFMGWNYNCHCTERVLKPGVNGTRYNKT